MNRSTATTKRFPRNRFPRAVLSTARTLTLACLTLAGLTASISCADKKPDFSPKVSEIPAQSFAKQWGLDLQLPKTESVVWLRSVGDYLVAFTTERRAYVVRRDSGTLVTIHAIKGNGDVLQPFSNGRLIAYPVGTGIELFDLTGKAVRELDLATAVQTTGALSDQLIFIAVSSENGGRMRAVDPAKSYQTLRWEILAFGSIVAAPVYYDQTLFFATDTGRVYAVNDQANPVWPIEKGYFQAGRVTADLTADDFGLYVASTDTRLTVLNRTNGRVKWQYFAGEPLEHPALPTADRVYLSVRNEGLVALNKTEGDFNRKSLWTNRESTQFLAEDAKYAYVRLRGNALGALDKTNGTVAFRSGRSDLDFFLTNTAKDAVIYGATKGGYLLGVRPVTKPGTVGQLLFTPDFPADGK